MKTNADVIREMTNEELRDFLNDYRMGEIDIGITFCGMCEKEDNGMNYDCDDCRLDWLKRDCTDCRGLKYWGEEE